MSYSPEQIEACILAYRNGDLNYCRAGIIDLLTAYAANLRQQAARVDEVEAREVVAAMEDAARRLYVIAETPEDNAASEVLLQAIPVVQAALSAQPAERQGEDFEAWFGRQDSRTEWRELVRLAYYTHPAAPVGVPDDAELLEIARRVGLRSTMHAVSASDARPLLRLFVQQVLAAAPSAPQAVDGEHIAMLREMLAGYGDSGFSAERAALESAIRALSAEKAGWRDMDSAPRDGTDILLYAPACEYQGKPCAERVTVGHWTTDEECRIDLGDCGGECHCREYEYGDQSWISWDGGFLAELPPTHWMPLPASPTPDKE